jgi:hypothetical protein
VDEVDMVIKHTHTRLYFLPSAPDTDEDEAHGYEIGDVVHVTGGSVYDCRDNTTAAAVWEERASGGSFSIHPLTEKTTLVLDDEGVFADSEDSFDEKRVTWLNQLQSIGEYVLLSYEIFDEPFDAGASGWSLGTNWAWESDGGRTLSYLLGMFTQEFGMKLLL